MERVVAVNTWQAVLIGVLVLLVLLWWGPGIKESVRNTRRGTAEEWRSALLPIALVALFVVLLIAMTR